MPNGDEPTRDSDLRSEARDYHVIATAALPLMTGTAVNPLLRAAYLLRRNGELAREREGGKGGGPLGDIIRECVMYYFTTIGISGIMCVSMYIAGETHVPYLHMMFDFRTLLYVLSIH